MIRRLIVVKLLVLICLQLDSCSTERTFVTHDDLNILFKGMKKEEFVKKITLYPQLTFSFKRQDKTFEVLALSMLYRRSSLYTGGSSPYTTIAHTNPLIFLFYEGKLRYWGLESEFCISEDEEIAYFSEELYSELDKHR